MCFCRSVSDSLVFKIQNAHWDSQRQRGEPPGKAHWYNTVRTPAAKNCLGKNWKDKKINCYAHNLRDNFIEIYLAVNGDVSPCCWLGDLKLHESKNIIKDYTKVNLYHTSLDNILNGDYFKELEKGIRGDLDAHRLHTCYFNCGVKDL